MADERRHLNFKLDAEASRLWDKLLKRATKAHGFELSQAQLVGAALKALEEKLGREEEAKHG